jgi:adenylate cyclase
MSANDVQFALQATRQREAAARVLEDDPAFTISAYIARGGQSNAKLLIEGLRKVGLPE